VREQQSSAGREELGAVAIFLDRDGVLNRLVVNEATGRYESPHRAEDFQLLPGVLQSLQKLQARGASLFVISNQPSAALGKTTFANLCEIHERFEDELSRRVSTSKLFTIVTIILAAQLPLMQDRVAVASQVLFSYTKRFVNSESRDCFLDDR